MSSLIFLWLHSVGSGFSLVAVAALLVAVEPINGSCLHACSADEGAAAASSRSPALCPTHGRLPRTRQRWLAILVLRVRHNHAPRLVRLGSLTLMAAALLAFAGIAAEMVEGETSGFDQAILLALRSPINTGESIGPRWLTEVARDVTSLGSTAVVTGVTVAAVCYLALANRRSRAALVAGSVAGGAILSTLLKLAFHRPRPEFAPYGLGLHVDSFPSGHAMLSAVTCLTLGALLAQLQARRRMRVYVMGLSIATTVLVGLSRVYLRVHWPTDVLAGWCLGAAWALLCWLVAFSVASRSGSGNAWLG